MGSTHKYRKIIVELSSNNIIMKKKILNRDIWGGDVHNFFSNCHLHWMQKR